MSIGDLAQLLRISTGAFSTQTVPIDWAAANQSIILKEVALKIVLFFITLTTQLLSYFKSKAKFLCLVQCK